MRAGKHCVLLCIFLLQPVALWAETPPPAPEPASKPAQGARSGPSASSDEELEAELREALGASDPTPTPTPAPTGLRVGSARLQLLDLSFDALFAAGGSSVAPEGIGDLHGGAHDPNKNGFTVQNLEMSLLGAVDPYLRGQVNLIFQIDEEGESLLEVEEAYLTTQTLPAGLQIKAGTFFTEAGRLNAQHPHSWDFADQPVVSSRMFGGDGLRGPGVRLSWLSSLPWYSELLGTVQNANGETAFSFLSSEEEGEFAGFPFVERPIDGPEDLLYSLRWLNSFALSDATALNAGATAVFGPNATGPSTRTTLLGADLYLKWRAIPNYQGYPFVSWQTELLYRSYEVGPLEKDEGEAAREEGSVEDLEDYGFYSQLVWGFRRGWVTGARLDWADGNGEPSDPLRDRRLRLSANLSYYPTEFSKLRLQYDLDRAEHLEDELQHSIWLQFEFLLGAHGAHTF